MGEGGFNWPKKREETASAGVDPAEIAPALEELQARTAQLEAEPADASAEDSEPIIEPNNLSPEQQQILGETVRSLRNGQ